MIADWILRLIDLIVPYGPILLLIIPLIILWKLGKWTIKAIFIALVLGSLLAWLAYIAT